MIGDEPSNDYEENKEGSKTRGDAHLHHKDGLHYLLSVLPTDSDELLNRMEKAGYPKNMKFGIKRGRSTNSIFTS
jgi:hypothetical protein